MNFYLKFKKIVKLKLLYHSKMDSEMGNKLPTLIEPEFLDNLLKEPDFDKKNRIIEVHLGPATRSDYEA